MKRRSTRFQPSFSIANETLESREVLSTMPLQPHLSLMAARAGRPTTPVTMIKVRAGTLGEPVTFQMTVRGTGGAAPQGTVNLISQRQVVQSLPLKPQGRSPVSQASWTFTPQPGGAAIFFGSHAITAQYVNASGQAVSSATTNFEIRQPRYRTLAGGTQYATIARGSGPAIRTGQTPGVFYTGYLSTGQIFDATLLHGTTPLTFKLGAGDVIPGFDAGITGMKVGESRIIRIPPSQGYGDKANAVIPANSTLIFVVTLKSIA